MIKKTKNCQKYIFHFNVYYILQVNNICICIIALYILKIIFFLQYACIRFQKGEKIVIKHKKLYHILINIKNLNKKNMKFKLKNA